MAHPFLPAARWSAAPAGRRYLAGWAMATELHVLNDPSMERRAAGDDSREALRGTAERLYAQLVVAANNDALPPSWTPRRFARYLRWAWLVEGGAQYFARQVGLYRAAVIRRLRESARPSFPPSRRDAVILGGTIFDLLETERGPDACERLALELLPGGPEATLEAAFEARFGEIEDAWRAYAAGDGPPERRLARAPGVPSSTSRASSAADSSTKTWRGPLARNSGTSKPGPRLSMLWMPWSLSSPWIISASIWLGAIGDFDQPVAAASAPAAAFVVARPPRLAAVGDRFTAFLK